MKVVGTPSSEKENFRYLKIGDDLISLIDENQYFRHCEATFLVDNIEKTLDEWKKKGVTFPEITDIVDYNLKEGKVRYVFLKMEGKDKFNGSWIELVERKW